MSAPMVSPVEIYALCRKYGPQLHVPSGIDGPRLMAAIAWNESSCGADTTPRYEKSYDLGGANCRNEQAPLVAGWPKDAQGRSLAAFSYGPWQMMPCNAPGMPPEYLADNPEICAIAFVNYANHWIFGYRQALTLDEFAQCYNAGHYDPKPSVGVARYVEDAFMHYHDPRVAAGLASEVTT